ncbi:MAG: M1 family metallopeptidase [bacterium]
MIKKALLSLNLIALIITGSVFSQTQNLYMPLDIKKAYDNGTRSYDGKPGINYWQNKSDYKIKATLLPDSSKLIGQEEITYFNNSPDTLKNITIRLYPDILKKGAARDWYIGPAELHDGVDISLLIIDGDTLNVRDRSSGVFRGSTNIFVRLKNPIPPNGKSKLSINWSFYIPQILKVRMGNYGNGEFFVAYWYPQISVYDDIDGWDNLDYEGSVEFYNDLNNYDFEITLPGRFVVWATGELKNQEEVFQPGIIEKINAAQKSDFPVNIISADDFKNNSVTLNNEENTWKFIAENVADVSFCISDGHVWDAASVEVEPGRRVLTSAVYADSTIHWNEAAKFAYETIKYMSFELPGYPYPYPQTTSFCNGNRGGGMETPMMANDGAPEERASSIGLVFHEISHTYFPFFMGTNERKYAWMDEGWATFFPRDVVKSFEPDHDAIERITREYERNAGKEAELPPMVLSYSNTTDYGRTAIYNRPALAYYALKELLGADLFKAALREYMNRWRLKHPIPYDFFYTFNDVAKEDLSWFWKPWFFEYGYPDLAIKDVSFENDEIKIIVQKPGNIPVPVKLKILFEDGAEQELNESARIWKDGKSETVLTYTTSKTVKKIVLGNELIPDANKKDNLFEPTK